MMTKPSCTLLLLASLAGPYPGTLSSQTVEWAIANTAPGLVALENMVLDEFGNLYVKGTFEGTIDLDPGPGVASFTAPTPSRAGFIQKLDPDGQFLWAQQVEEPPGLGQGYLVGDASDGIFHADNFQGTVDLDPGPGLLPFTPQGPEGAYIRRLDGTGQLVWAGQFESSAGVGLGPMQQDGSGGLWVVTGSTADLDVDPGPGTLWVPPLPGLFQFAVVHLDAQGGVLWVGRMQDLSVIDLHGEVGGGFTLVGSTTAPTDIDMGQGVAIASGIVFAEYDQQGALVRHMTLQPNGLDVHAVDRDAAGALYVTGRITSSSYDLDPGPGVLQLAAYPLGNTFLAKYDPLLDLEWARSFGPLTISEGNDVAVDPFGNVHVAGRMAGSFDADPGPDTTMLTLSGDNDGFVLSMDAAGAFLRAGVLGGTGTTDANRILSSASGALTVAGRFNAMADLDPGPGQLSFTAQGQDLFVVRFGPITASVNAVQYAPLRVGPNPTRGPVQVHLPPDMPQAWLQLRDAAGRCIRELGRGSGTPITLDLSDLAPGTYLLVDRRGGLAPQRLVKH